MVPIGGKHLIVDYWGTNNQLLSDTKTLTEILREGAIRSGASILFDHFHHFGGEYGVTGVLVLAESHISIHTWPEEQYCSLDIYMCGDCDPNIAEQHIRKQLEPTIFKIIEHKRGEL